MRINKERLYLDTIEKQLLHEPDNGALLLNKAILLYLDHSIDEAIELFYGLLKKNPNNIEVYFWFADCLFGHTTLYEEAERVLRSALRISDKHAGCHVLLAATLKALNADKNEIIAHYKRAIELEPTWIAPRIYFAGFLETLGFFAEAKIEILEALKRIPEKYQPIEDPIQEHYHLVTTGFGDNEAKKVLFNALESLTVSHH